MEPFPELSGPAGAAYLLASPPRESVVFEHHQGRISLRAACPLVSVELNEISQDDDIRAVPWRVVQESLDVLAATGRSSLVTSKGDTDYLFWERKGEMYELTCVTTAELQWSMQAHGTFGGGAASWEPPPYVHHECLRYYRMAKCTSDLFDAFRNIYLGFECLVSSVSPKCRGEPELDWLRRVVNGPLRNGVPGGMDTDALLEAVYRSGRNPLFHAKVGQSFHSPHGEVREEIQGLFEKLSLLLVALIQHKFGAHAIRRWGSLSRAAQDSQTRSAFEFDEVQFSVGAEHISVWPEKEVVDSPRRFHQLWAIARTRRPEGLSHLRNARFVRAGQEWMSLEVEEEIPLDGVCQLKFEINVASRNVHEPRAFHLR